MMSVSAIRESNPNYFERGATLLVTNSVNIVEIDHERANTPLLAERKLNDSLQKSPHL